MEEGAELVSRYMQGRRTRDVGSSETRMDENHYQDGEGMGVEEDEDEEDEDYGLDDDDDVDEDMGQGSSSDAQGRRFRSKAWREFEPIHVDGEVTKGECKHCSTIISAKRGHGTSGLRNHLNRCKDRAAVVEAEIVTQKDITCELSLCLDVPNRWNSTFKMLIVAMRYRRAFDELDRQDPQYEYAPSADEWEEAKEVCKLLKVFYEATNVISGSKYPTANLYFQQMWQAKEALDKEARREDSPFPAMIAPMQQKLEKYWKVSWLALSIPVILDPRFKFTYLEFRYPQVFGDGSSTKLARVKEVFKELFEEYAKLTLSGTTQTQQGVEDMDMGMEGNDPLSDWDRHLSLRNNSTSVGSSELDAYWLKPPLAQVDRFDILVWWKANSVEYPILASMARDCLAVPASTVPSESAFSTGRRVISDFRSRLTPDTAEALICLQDWFHTSNATNLSTASVYDTLGDEGLFSQIEIDPIHWLLLS